MLIRAITRMAGSVAAAPGDVRDVDPKTARELIKGGYASEVHPDELDEETDPETTESDDAGSDPPKPARKGTTQRRRGKKTS